MLLFIVVVFYEKRYSNNPKDCKCHNNVKLRKNYEILLEVALPTCGDSWSQKTSSNTFWIFFIDNSQDKERLQIKQANKSKQEYAKVTQQPKVVSKSDGKIEIEPKVIVNAIIS